jgi:hypothetical protein
VTSSDVPSISYVEVEPVSVPEARVSTAAESQPEIDPHAHPKPEPEPETETETGGASTESESGLQILFPLLNLKNQIPDQTKQLPRPYAREATTAAAAAARKTLKRNRRLIVPRRCQDPIPGTARCV